MHDYECLTLVPSLPLAVLYGLFLYIGVASLKGVQVCAGEMY